MYRTYGADPWLAPQVLQVLRTRPALSLVWGPVHGWTLTIPRENVKGYDARLLSCSSEDLGATQATLAQQCTGV